MSSKRSENKNERRPMEGGFSVGTPDEHEGIGLNLRGLNVWKGWREKNRLANNIHYISEFSTRKRSAAITGTTS